jgi:chemotaxis response regulator CheB
MSALHRAKESDDPLVDLLRKFSRLPVSETEDKKRVGRQHVYLAPAD